MKDLNKEIVILEAAQSQLRSGINYCVYSTKGLKEMVERIKKISIGCKIDIEALVINAHVLCVDLEITLKGLTNMLLRSIEMTDSLKMQENQLDVLYEMKKEREDAISLRHNLRDGIDGLQRKGETYAYSTTEVSQLSDLGWTAIDIVSEELFKNIGVLEDELYEIDLEIKDIVGETE